MYRVLSATGNLNTPAALKHDLYARDKNWINSWESSNSEN